MEPPLCFLFFLEVVIPESLILMASWLIDMFQLLKQSKITTASFCVMHFIKSIFSVVVHCLELLIILLGANID